MRIDAGEYMGVVVNVLLSLVVNVLLSLVVNVLLSLVEVNMRSRGLRSLWRASALIGHHIWSL